MQTNRRKRIIAITRESINVYQSKKRFILLLTGLLIGAGAIYMFLLIRLAPAKNQAIDSQTTHKSALLLLEDSVSVANKQLLQLNKAIDQQIHAEKNAWGAMQENKAIEISNTNKQLIIRKMEAVLKYLKTPLNQFNQLPTYFINNTALEQQIKSYNDELMKLQTAYKEKSPYDTSYFASLELSRNDLINKLEAEKTLLLKPNQKPKAKRFNAPQPSENLIAMFNERDSVTEVYSDLLQRYQKRLSQVQVNDLMDSLTKPQFQTTAVTDVESIYLPREMPKWLLTGLLLVASVGIIPFFVVFLRKYKSPFVKRPADIELSGRTEDIVLELNKEVNQELVAFNYEPLIRAVENLGTSHKLVTFYSVDAEREQHVISTQLASLLTKLGNKVVYMDLCTQFGQLSTKNECTYELTDFIEHTTNIAHHVLQKAMEQKEPVVIKMVKTDAKQHEPMLHDYWSLQHFFANTRLREMLAAFKQYFHYVVISTPDFLAVDSSLLAVPQKDINIHVFKAGSTTRRSANLLCKLNGNDPTPSLSVIDFSKPPARSQG
ncbi:hypothetical protein RYH73_24130 [Olivibacter sp. CPCC 100613]|uniref:hypothetical protein n=1 Tax=Olivibacter sp. CPCC 100613 TaxID=3079931 RepID=UPI002FF99E10